MEFELFGLKLHLESIILTLVLVWITSVHLLCSCSKVNFMEGLKSMDINLGSDVDENLTKDVHGNYSAGSALYQKALNDTHKPLYLQKKFESTKIPLEGTMDFFQKTKFLPECCPSTYSKGDGCACLSDDQMEHIKTRGGNRNSGNF